MIKCIEDVFGYDSIGYPKLRTKGITLEEFMDRNSFRPMYAMVEIQEDLECNIKSLYKIFLYRTLGDLLYHYYGGDIKINKGIDEELGFKHISYGPCEVWFDSIDNTYKTTNNEF